MKNSGNMELDIMKNISAIEKLKCDILTGTANLFQGMVSGGSKTSFYDNKEILSKLLIDIYLLSDKMGIGYITLDEAAARNLKTDLLMQDYTDSININQLIRHLRRTDTDVSQ